MLQYVLVRGNYGLAHNFVRSSKTQVRPDKYLFTAILFFIFPQHDLIIFVPAEISSWPSSKTLFLLRLWSMIFPCSDFRHVVILPAILLMCEYLMRCPIVSGRDSAIGSFLCSMLLSVCINLFAISSFSIVRVCLDRTYFAETENLLLKSL